ncbi:MotA/TolQ/ExbB proton channel family protein [Bdellovibrionota bacterium FG-2]
MPLWIIATLWMSRLVLVVLLGLSIWSIAIMIERRRTLRDLQSSDPFLEAQDLIRSRNWEKLSDWTKARTGLRSGMISSALEVMQGPDSSQSIDRAARSFMNSKKSDLEKGLTTLATLGSNAPFIGLFGTVLGIIRAFGALSSSQSDATAVMTGISEALVATAVGLYVAIPAVVAYNVFSRKIRLIILDCDALKDLLISRLEPREK